MSKRFVITESEKNEIRRMYGLITEDNNNLPNLPQTISNSWTAPDCDAMHAFQSRQEDEKDKNGNTIPDPQNPRQNKKISKVYGDMNALVTEKLVEYANANIPAKVTDITITVSGMKIDYTVTINKDPNGKGFNGFTSRGAGCGSLSVAKAKGFNNTKEYLNSRATTEGGKTVNEIKSNIQSNYGNVLNFETVKTFYDDNVPDGNKLLQVFYQYKSERNPNVKSQKTINAEKEKQKQQQDQGQQQKEDQVQNYSITGSDIPNLRENIKNQTYNKGLKIDIDSIRCDIKNLKVTFESGETAITSMSLIFDNVSEQSLQDRIKNKIIPQNPGFTKTGWAGYNNGYWWVLGVIK